MPQRKETSKQPTENVDSLRLNFSSSQKKIKKCRQNMFHQSGKIHKNTIFHIYIYTLYLLYIMIEYRSALNAICKLSSRGQFTQNKSTSH